MFLNKIQYLIKEFTPPFFYKIIKSKLYGWSGNYKNWELAASKSSGYNSEIIFNKVRDSLLKVKNGQYLFERDSVLFDKIYYSLPLLSTLGLVSLNCNNKINVLDFGGSLGSSYYQNKNLFTNLLEFNWCIVEQHHFVIEGKKNFEDNYLHFYHDVNSCLSKHNINLLLLSSVLQYIEKPYQLIENLINLNIQYILIDRMPIMFSNSDRLLIQKVPKSIYKAKYPAWLLSEKKLLTLVQKNYNLIFDEETTESINYKNSKYKAYLFKLK